MGTIHGSKGFIEIGTGVGSDATILNVSGWTLDEKVDAQESTELNAAAPTARTWDVQGLPERNLTIEFVADTAGMHPAPGITFSVTLNHDGSNSIEGIFIMGSQSSKEEINDLQRVTMVGKFTGTVTRVSAG